MDWRSAWILRHRYLVSWLYGLLAFMGVMLVFAAVGTLSGLNTDLWWAGPCITAASLIFVIPLYFTERGSQPAEGAWPVDPVSVQKRWRHFPLRLLVLGGGGGA